MRDRVTNLELLLLSGITASPYGCLWHKHPPVDGFAYLFRIILILGRFATAKMLRMSYPERKP
jgi:hypothetical protein